MTAPTIPDRLLAGPRGRRLLLESERLRSPDYSENALRSAVLTASIERDSGAQRYVALTSGGEEYPDLTASTPAQIAELIQALPLAPVTAAGLLTSLAHSVDMARYWQEPDGDDALAGTAEIIAALRVVAEHLAASPLLAAWEESAIARPQWSIAWSGARHPAPLGAGRELLQDWRAEVLQEEERALQDRPRDATASWGGIWWSTPPRQVPTSCAELSDGSPAGLWFVEDSLGWDSAEALRLGFPAQLRVFTIEGSEAWAQLCTRFPLEVTASKRHDWYRVTGRDGRWVIPDWSAVAEHYDAVHLPTLSYLELAGTAIAVGADAASVIAGWSPGETFWFTDQIRYVDEPTRWELVEYTEAVARGQAVIAEGVAEPVYGDALLWDNESVWIRSE